MPRTAKRVYEAKRKETAREARNCTSSLGMEAGDHAEKLLTSAVFGSGTGLLHLADGIIESGERPGAGAELQLDGIVRLSQDMRITDLGQSTLERSALRLVQLLLRLHDEIQQILRRL